MIQCGFAPILWPIDDWLPVPEYVQILKPAVVFTCETVSLPISPPADIVAVVPLFAIHCHAT